MAQTFYSIKNLIFKEGFTITQFFGVNHSYYKKFGLRGHEGIDLIPNNSDWSILAPEDGKVVRDIDSPRDNYGNLVVVWNKEKKRAWWFAHNASNNVSIGDYVKKGQTIATMGNTGNSTGPHLHLGLRLSDENGNAQNLSNGYMGFINPLDTLLSLAPKEEKTISLPVVDFERMVFKSDMYDQTIRYINIAKDPAHVHFDEVKRELAPLMSCKEESAREMVRLHAEIKNRKEQVERLERQVESEQEIVKILNKSILQQAEENKKIVSAMQKKEKKQAEQIDEMGKTVGTLKKDLADSLVENKLLKEQINNKVLTDYDLGELITILILKIKLIVSGQ